MITLEHRRHVFAEIVVRMARRSATNTEIKVKLVGIIRHKASSCRNIYFAPYGLVIKFDDWPKNDQNRCEHLMSKRHPRYTPKVYGHFSRENGPSVLISERVKPGWNGHQWSKRAKQFHKLFDDVHRGNVGTRRGKLVMLDTGCGYR